MHKVHAGPHGLAVIRVTGESPRGDGVDVTLLRDRVNDGEPWEEGGFGDGSLTVRTLLSSREIIYFVDIGGWMARQDIVKQRS
jgi:hypothetical protein